MDVTAAVVAAMSAWLGQVARDVFAPAEAALGALLFSTPQLDRVPLVTSTWAVVRNITDALFVLAWLAAGVLVMSSADGARYSVKLIVPRLVLGGVLANASLAVSGGLIDLSNAVTAALLGDSGAVAVARALQQTVVDSELGSQILGALLLLAAGVFALGLVAIRVGCVLVLALLVALAPLALAAYALPQTQDIARLWWRASGALLVVQPVQAALMSLGVAIA